jgi:signal transduction histidine kinase
MQENTAKNLSAAPHQEFSILVAAMPISARHRAIGLSLFILLFAVFAVMAPFADMPLARVDAFIPVIQTVMCVVDLITAALLFGQYAIQPKFAILAVASGYMFSGLFAFIQTLAFPGAYSASGLIGDGVNTAAWLFVAWHVSFNLPVIAYALSKDVDGARGPVVGSTAVTIGFTIACILGVTAGLTWIASETAGYFPILYVGVTQQQPFARGLDLFLLSLNIATLLILFVRRRTILDLWLMVILIVWWPNFVLPIFVPLVRFTLGWYAGRGFALFATSTLLFVLLSETTALYARVANTVLLLRRERADRFMSVDAATSAMAHEIRQPLTGIAARGTAALKWLSRLPPGPELEKLRELISSMVESSFRAEEIIKGIRGLFRPAMSRQRVPLQLNDVVREALSFAHQDLQTNAVSVATEYGNNLPQIDADRTQIQQVVLNLVKNAIDAMRDVSVRKRHLRILTSFDGKSCVALYIQDSGLGVATNNRESIFEPFFTTKPSGTGLGLSICRTIVEGHGGILRLGKSDGRGSSFELVFPIG